jgi:hypothetical protein
MFDDSNINYRPSGHKRIPGGQFNALQGTGIFLHHKTISEITPYGAIIRWIVISSGKRSKVIRYFFLKFLYDELTKKEYEVFLSFEEVTRIFPIYFALKARNKRINKKTIRKILENIKFPSFKIPTREEYQGLKTMYVSFEKKTYPPIIKPKPYSGYRRSQKDGKSSGTSVEEFNSTPLEFRPIFEDEINIFIDFAEQINHNPRYLNLIVQHLNWRH